MIAEVQSSSPRAPSSSRTARCSRRHSPASVHAVNRRCAVAGETPNVGGRRRQAQPLVGTYTTAVNSARSSTGLVPPPCGRDVNFGSSGAANSHNPYGTSRRDRSTATVQHHPASATRHVRRPLGQEECPAFLHSSHNCAAPWGSWRPSELLSVSEFSWRWA